MRRAMRTIPMVLAAVLALSAPLVGGCGVDETSFGPARPGPTPPPVEDDRGSNLDDTSLTEIQLETSFAYDSDADRGLAFFAFRDQDGNSIWDFKNPGGTPGFEINGYNFTITLFPSVAPRQLDPDTFEVGTEYRDVKVVALVIDVSGSMEEDAGNGQTRLDVAKEVAKDFVDAVLADPASGDLVALVSFSSDANLLMPLTSDAGLIKDRIDGLSTEGATNFGGALTEAVKAVGIQPGKRAVVFLTDGADTVDGVSGEWGAWNGDDNSLRWQAMEQLVEYELVTYAIGFGPAATGADADLRAFAGDASLTPAPPDDLPVGEFFPAETADDLNDAFDPDNPDGILAKIEAQSGTTSPFVSFPNDYPSAAGPIQTRVVLWFENANGNLYDVTTGTYIPLD